jgi:hypothetical protein
MNEAVLDRIDPCMCADEPADLHGLAAWMRYGGLKTTSDTEGLLELEFDLNLEKTSGLNGASIRVSAFWIQDNDDPSADFVGTLTKSATLPGKSQGTSTNSTSNKNSTTEISATKSDKSLPTANSSLPPPTKTLPKASPRN